MVARDVLFLFFCFFFVCFFCVCILVCRCGVRVKGVCACNSENVWVQQEVGDNKVCIY